MAKLDLKRTLDGRLKRLHLYKNGLTKEDINSISWIPGFNNNKNVISLPTSIKTMYDVVQALPEKVELTSDMEEWKDNIEQQIKDLRAIKNQEVDEPQLKTEGLYDYQKYDVVFMERAKRCINAGQVGVGKTIEAIGWMNELPKDSKVLVIAKKSLTYNWYHEMEEWLLDNPKVSLADGHKGSRKEALASDTNHFIINFAMLRKNKYPSLFEEDWDLVIADEAHKIRNRKSQTSKGFARLSSERMGLLTGTPILNSPEELWHLLHVLYPKMFSSYWQFKKKYCKTKFNPFGYEDDVVGVKNKSFFHFVQDYLLVKRLKEEVLSDLPDMNFHTKVIELPKPQKEIYDQMQNEMFTVIKDKWLMAGTNLEQLIRLRQLALSPKIHDSDVEGGKTKFIRNWLEDNPEEKLVVFSNSKQYLYILRESLSAYGALMITGDQKDEVRYDNQDAFQEDDDHRVILLTYGAGCEGHTLTRANTLIRADMAWSPEINAQAAGRVHRITQTEEVDIIDLKAKDTIDENVFEILKVKQKKIDETWGKE